MTATLTDLLPALQTAVNAPCPVPVHGRVTQVLGTVIHAIVPGVRLGEICFLQQPGRSERSVAEVIGFRHETVLLTALGDLQGISTETEVWPTHQSLMIPVGDALLGRIIDGFGNPLDDAPDAAIAALPHVPLTASPCNPLKRRRITTPLTLGVRALDTALTCGEGQRLGIFAAAGVGKSTLLAQIMRHTQADITVLALIGERGREVREFIEQDLGADGLRRAVVVVATSDRPAMERVTAAYTATAIAEAFRDCGKRVLLLMDSVTRLARARRDIGLAAGEPPVRRGFTPSVFAELPRLMERAGNGETGSITALYTVLVEGDDKEDPIAEEVKSILDGHIVLSDTLAARGHYPAIDVLRSVSRCQPALIDPSQQALVRRLRLLLSEYDAVELLLKLGEYQLGSRPSADDAIAHIDRINAFLQQPFTCATDAPAAWAALKEALA
ncbi:MAG: FliI/YscN family ATPase [Kiritimatiellae bacterium]|nr:FliI/YscN family ATPase [Kiritimatiellia bacterium]